LPQSQLDADSDVDAKVLYLVYYCIYNNTLRNVKHGRRQVSLL